MVLVCFRYVFFQNISETYIKNIPKKYFSFLKGHYIPKTYLSDI